MAKKRLAAGTTIVVEQPYAAAPLLESLPMACCHCFKRTLELFPCDRHRKAGVRSRGLFCGPNCAESYWARYGEYESKNPFFLICPVDCLLALRLLREQRPVAVEIDVKKFRGEGIPEEFTGEFGPQYANSLVQYSSELYPSAKIGGKETVLTAFTLFFGAVPPESAERLVKAMRQVTVNSFVVGCNDRVMNDRMKDQHVVVNMRLGKGVYLLSSLFNHSCDPNCAFHVKGEPFASSSELHIKLTRTAMEGEELCICYDGIHKNINHSTRARIGTLRQAYGFACICNACGNIVDDAVKEEDKEHYYKAADLYQKGRRLCREGNYTEAVNVLGHSLDLVFEKICPPPREPQLMVAKTHDAMAQAYQLMGDKEKCAKHVELGIEVLKLHHGEDDEPLHREYVKLAMLYKDLGNVELHAKYASKARQLIELHYPHSLHLEAELAFLLS